MVGSETELQTIEGEFKKLKDEVYKEDSKINVLKYQTQVIDLQIQRLNEEVIKNSQLIQKFFFFFL